MKDGTWTAGAYHTCAILIPNSGGGADTMCWGLNNIGQLGDGYTTNRAGPSYGDRVQFATGRSAVDIDAGSSHTCASPRRWLRHLLGSKTTGGNWATARQTTCTAPPRCRPIRCSPSHWAQGGPRSPSARRHAHMRAARRRLRRVLGGQPAWAARQRRNRRLIGPSRGEPSRRNRCDVDPRRAGAHLRHCGRRLRVLLGEQLKRAAGGRHGDRLKRPCERIDSGAGRTRR